MTALSADAVRETRGNANQRLHKLPVAASTTIYKGALVCIDADGYAVPAANTSGYSPVVGLAQENVDNSSGADGALNIEVASNIEVKLTASSVAATMLGRETLYVVDDNTVDELAGANGIVAGAVAEFVSSTEAWVHIPTFGVLTSEHMRGKLNVTLVAGGVAGNHTVTGIAVGDEIVAVLHASTAVSIATLADITGEFSIDSANTIDNAAGTDTSSDQLWVIWIDHT